MSNFRTPLKRALGNGSAKRGVNHFMTQRLTAVALALLAFWVVWMVLGMVRLDHAGAYALVAKPLNAVLLLGFILAVFWHAQLGLQVVIEDYVHNAGSKVVFEILVKFLCFLGAAASALAVIRIALGH